MLASNTVDRSSQTSITSLVYLAWLSVALFYCYQYILRVAPGVLVTDLRQTYHLTAEQFGTLGAFYLYAYALSQIPLGILVDYIGVRRTVIISICFCIMGAFLFAHAQSLMVLQLSRILVGLGSASAFMCALKVVVDYLPAGNRGFLMGATLTLGTIGALVAGKPLALLSDYAGWRSAVYDAGFLGILILLLGYFCLPQPKKENLNPVSLKTLRTIPSSLLAILKTRPVMLYAILAIAVYTPLSVLADLWGVSFLMQKYALSRTEASQVSMLMYLGMGLGCLILPWLSEKYHFLNRSIQVCSFGILVVFACLIYGPAFSVMQLECLLILLGVFCGVEMLCFTGASQYTTPTNVGITLGVVNTFNMLGGGLLQQGIGYLLDQLWTGQLDAYGLRHYSSHDFMIALSLLFGVVLICCLLTFCLPRNSTACK